MINVPALFDSRYGAMELIYKDGFGIISPFRRTVSYDNVITQSLRITYNNTEDDTGRYHHGAYLNFDSLRNCTQYLYLYYYPLFILHWNIRSYSELILHNYLL